MGQAIADDHLSSDQAWDNLGYREDLATSLAVSRTPVLVEPWEKIGHLQGKVYWEIIGKILGEHWYFLG